MQLALAATSNPWNIPALDPAIARRAVAGIEAGEAVVEHLIDRSIAVRVLLDRDLKSGVFSSDSKHAVDLLVRARGHAYGTVTERHLSSGLRDQLIDWTRANPGDTRLRVVPGAVGDIRGVVTDLLDDDEGNVREAIRDMGSHPNRQSWRYVRAALDGGIASAYAARDSIRGALHVLRAAGDLY